MKVLILLALAAYTQAIAPGGTTDCDVEVVFALDDSGSISDTDSNLMKDFIKDVISLLSIDDGSARVGMVIYSSSASLKWGLNGYATKATLLPAVEAMIRVTSGGTNTAQAISVLETELVSNSNSGVPMVGIVLTDGGSNSPSATATAAANAKTAGIHMIAVGIQGANIAELNVIASDAASVKFVNQASDLVTIIDAVAKIACTPPCGNKCTVCSCGPTGPTVETFDGLHLMILSEQKTTLFIGGDDELDPCKTTIRCVTTVETTWNMGYDILHLDWCGIALNVHWNPFEGGHRNWIVGQTLDYIGERGQGLSGDTIIPFNGGTIEYPDLDPVPDRLPACDPQQEANVVGDSICITSACCNWCVRWTPRVGCTCIEIFTDDKWAGTTGGICGNMDGDKTNDWNSCGATNDVCKDDFQCLSDECASGAHNGQAFIGGTRMNEGSGNAPPDSCY